MRVIASFCGVRGNYCYEYRGYFADTAMPSTVTLFSVKIACPGDAAMELVVALDVIAQWNARHALDEKRILLPLGEDLAGDAEHDLLIEFFCGSIVPTEADSAAAEEEIESQLRQGRPAL